MNLKIPGAILPLGCAILSTRAKNVRGVVATPLRRTRVKRGTLALSFDQKFKVPTTRTTLMKGQFFSDTIRLWNVLPQQVVDSPTLDVFKTRVSDVTRWLKRDPIIPFSTFFGRTKIVCFYLCHFFIHWT